MFEQFIEQVKKIVTQYEEGVIFAEEGFNAIVARAITLSNTEEYAAHIASAEAKHNIPEIEG